MEIWSDIAVKKGTIIEYKGDIYEVVGCSYIDTYDNREHYKLKITNNVDDDLLQ